MSLRILNFEFLLNPVSLQKWSAYLYRDRKYPFVAQRKHQDLSLEEHHVIPARSGPCRLLATRSLPEVCWAYEGREEIIHYRGCRT